MKKKALKKRVEKLEKKCARLEKDKLTIYNLLYYVNKELDEALENKQTFISSMSHEIRSPLTAVLGNSALLGETDLTQQQIKYLAQLNESADFLMALLGDLLDVSKLKENQIELSLQEESLDSILLNCANMVESKISKEVEFISAIPALDYYVFVDKKRVQQIFTNLLSNAAKFTKSGKIEFTLLEIKPINHQLEVVVEVKDTGLGIPSRVKKSLFEPFTSTDVEEGTGLGLYISYQLATLMGGKIEVHSKEGEGSSFQVTFYCEKSKLKRSKVLQHTHTSLVKKEQHYAHLRVLIVEDLTFNRKFLKEMFSIFFGIDVQSAENGQVALDKLKKSQYDIIFMDLKMPVLDGIETTKRIRRLNSEIPIICMSANVYKENKREAKEAGMNDFIEKPLSPKDIEARLAQLLSPLEHKQNNSLRNRALAHFKTYFDEETGNNFIAMAEEGLKKYIKGIEKGIRIKKSEMLILNLHGIKGILANLGLEELSKKAGELLQYAENEDFVKIKNNIDDFLVEVKEFFN